ncbi:MAG TPA: protein kinase, partial [Vicinamibacterales bacterium]|nr:protein kinase [Vicinamibacterales bacterium]
ALTPGTRLGPYEIAAQIGAGGMGEVYRATDSRLKRDVAIKVLPDAVAGDADRLARFQREAEVLAALNHPNIAGIHGLEDVPSAGSRQTASKALVMELVEGPTLADRPAKGSIPVDEALALARQIAGALEAAHEQGIVHRDLKPANVKVRPDGTVKVLDFGLAKVTPPASAGSPGASQSPTMTALAQSGHGVLLGTAPYMSPEQARGRVVDRRADIWAFGCVLYEMLTGRAAFTGEDTLEILTSVLRGSVNLDRLPADAPGGLRRVIARCLSGDLKKRYRHIGDVLLELDENGIEPAAVSVQAPRGGLPWLVAAALGTIAIVALAGLWRATRPVEGGPRPLVRLNVDLGADVSLGSERHGRDAILSPDGTVLVYVSGNRLFARRLDQPASTELPGTDGAFSPFFSPDGRWVAFFAAGALRKVPVQAGGAVGICACAGNPGGASWGDDETIVGSFNLPGALSRVSADGGDPEPLDGSAPAGIWPQVLPGGTAILFTSVRGGPGAFDTIEAYSLVDRSRRTLLHGGTFARYLPSGHLTYFREGTMFAVPFDLDRLEVRGEAVAVLDDVAYDAIWGFPELHVSASGTLVYQAGSERGGGDVLEWLERGQPPRLFLGQPAFYVYPRLSPDGRHLVVGRGGGQGTSVWVHELDGGRSWPVSRNRLGLMASWTPDGRYVIFGGARAELSWVPFDGGGQPQPLVTGLGAAQAPLAFTSDGTRLAVRVQSGIANYDVWLVPVEIDAAGLEAGEPQPLLTSEADERSLDFSPDGRWFAYASNESGPYRVYVRAFPDTGRRWVVSSGDGTDPRWSRNGQELFYRTSDDRLMVAAYGVEGAQFKPGAVRPYAAEAVLSNAAETLGLYDVSPIDGRVLAVMPAERSGVVPARHHLVFLQNFLDELRRLVPTE